jgi:hypothetical protein
MLKDPLLHQLLQDGDSSIGEDFGDVDDGDGDVDDNHDCDRLE